MKKIAKHMPTGSFLQPLTPKEEKFYLNMYENGNEKQQKEAKDALVERNMRLVAYIAKKYPSESPEDLISIGTIGLIKGVSSFDAKKASKLSTYISKCIENEILMHLRSLKKYNNEISMQDFIGTDREGNNITLEDKIADEDAPIDEIIALKTQVKSMYELIENVLDKRERQIIELRYGIGQHKDLTQREIGNLLNISRSYVSRIEKRSLNKLREELSKENL